MAIAVSLAQGTFTNSVSAMYHMGQNVNEYVDDHIKKLKSSTNPTVSCTGRVLEAAKEGFGIGYISSVTVIAAGQLLLGSPLAAVSTVATAAVLMNPIAMTCAAVGAISYGWAALSTQEQTQILDRLSTGLQIGVELIRSIVQFVVRTLKELLTSKQLADFKDFIKTQAAQFGRSLHEITHLMGDYVMDAAEKTGELTERAIDATSVAVRGAVDSAGDLASKAGELASHAASETAEAAGEVATKAAAATRTVKTKLLKKKPSTPDDTGSGEHQG